MIQLHTLGDIVITVGDREVRPTSPTLFAALLYLGVERGQRVPRIALQELLFPETDERSGAHSLRQLLYKLRQLGASVHAEGDVVWLAAEDVSDDYSAPAHTNGNGNGNGNGANRAFLAGYVPRLSTTFDEWLESRRATIEVARRRSLVKQMLARRDAADWISVERIAQEVLAGDPFNEEATFALAESTALAGSKSEAIRILERYESETGSADLKLPASILRKRISERLPDRRRRALDTPFVGRDAEAQIMREAVVRLRSGIGCTVVISGEPGIGKTRLLEETTALALLEGVNVHVVRCQPHYVNRPMGVFIEWVPMLMQSRGALGVSPETMEHLKLLTSHSDDRPNRPTDARDDSTRSGILMAAVRDLVDAVASEAPIFLAVEDAHWADATSLRDLCTLLERRKSHSLLLSYTTRLLEPLKEVGVLSDSAEQLKLRPLVDNSMLGLSRHLLGASNGGNEGIEAWCAKTASGNPLYLQMLCAHYDDTRQPYTVPPSMRTAITRRIEQLPLDARRVLEYSALLGRHATLAAIRSLTGLPHKHFLNAVQSLEELGHLRTEGPAARLCHDLLQESTLDLVPPLARQVLHGGVATYLETRYDATHDSSLLWDCAEHWAASGDLSRAVRFVIRCALYTADIGQAPKALELLLRSRQFATSTEESFELLQEISRLAKVTRRFQLVLDVEEEILKLAPHSVAKTHSESELRVFEAGWVLSLASNNARSLLACANSADAAAEHRVDAAYLAIRIAHEIGDEQLAHDAYAAIAPILQPQSIRSNDALVHLIFQTSFGDSVLAISVARSMRDALPTLDLASQIRVARNLGVAFCLLGRPVEGFTLHERFFDVALRTGLLHWQFDLASACCQALTNAEDFERAELWFTKAEELRKWATGTILELSHFISGVDIALQRGMPETAKARLAELLRLPQGESFRMKTHTRCQAIRVAHLDPSFHCDEATLTELAGVLPRATQFMCGDNVAVALGHALLRLGRQNQLRKMLQDYLGARKDALAIPNELVALTRGNDLTGD